MSAIDPGRTCKTVIHINSDCEICGEIAVTRWNPVEIRCRNCRSKYKLAFRLNWLASWVVDLVSFLLFFVSAAFSINILAIWPFFVYLLTLYIGSIVGRSVLDEGDAFTQFAKKRYQRNMEA